MSEPPASAEEAARELVERLEARAIPYAVGGALALNQWAVPRGTKDVDLNLWVDPARPTSTAQLLGAIGCDLKASAVVRSLSERGHAFARLGDVRVDVYVPTHVFHASVLERRRRRPLAGREAWFLSAEDLAVFKLILDRAKDRADVEALAMVGGEEFDRSYVRRWLQKIVGAHDNRLSTWEEIVRRTDAALRLREGQEP